MVPEYTCFNQDVVGKCGRGGGEGGGRERERERVMPDESFTGLFSPTLIIVSIQFSINDVL